LTAPTGRFTAPNKPDALASSLKIEKRAKKL
jgi:hypothetical protein